MNSLNLAAGGSREGWRGVGVREGERRRGTETRRGDKCGGRCRRLAGRAGWVIYLTYSFLIYIYLKIAYNDDEFFASYI